MSEETQTLHLFKYNTSTDGNQLFNINVSLNDNWDKIDTFAENVNNTVDNINGAIDNINDSKQDKSNLVTSISSSSTDSEYPSAKCVYDIVGDIETLLSEI